MKVRDILKLLANDGWETARTRGSHRQLKHPTKKGTVTVAGKPSLDIPPGTLKSIYKQANIDRKD
ncbi:MAG: type II toxin-antitoxin system HicA family toxin [Opitutales bacterium]|nr:type II toxin-antitoxin system HicA family toxin [Opitutales bacterium]